MFTSIKNSLVLLAVTCLIGVQSAQATDQVSQELLNNYWSVGLKKQTDRYFAGQQDRTPESIYAYALVKTRQHDIKMAIKAIDVLQKMQPENARPLRLKVWLELRYDKYEPALASLVNYMTLIKQDDSITGFERTAASEFAGRIFGFLDGPVGNKVNMGDRDAAMNAVLSGLSEQDYKAFEAAYAGVANKYNGLVSQKRQVDADAAAQDKVIQQAKYKSLVQREKQLHEAEQRTAMERQRTRAAINKGLTDIARKDLTYANRGTVLRPTFVRPHRKVLIHTSGGKKIVGGTKHPHVVGFHVARPTYLRSSYYDQQARRDILAGHYNTLREVGAGQMNSLNKELKEISKAKQRTMGQKLRALRPSGKIVTKSVALKAKARSITTYEQFPLEIERQLLLATTK